MKFPLKIFISSLIFHVLIMGYLLLSTSLKEYIAEPSPENLFDLLSIIPFTLIPMFIPPILLAIWAFLGLSKAGTNKKLLYYYFPLPLTILWAVLLLWSTFTLNTRQLELEGLLYSLMTIYLIFTAPMIGLMWLFSKQAAIALKKMSGVSAKGGSAVD